MDGQQGWVPLPWPPGTPSPAQVKPTGSLILAKPAEADTKTAGGVLLPTSSQQAPTTGGCTGRGRGWRGARGGEGAGESPPCSGLTDTQLLPHLPCADTACSPDHAAPHLDESGLPKRGSGFFPAGRVVELGDGRVSDGQFDFSVKPGDTILYSKYKFGTTDLELGSVPHFLIKEEDVLGVLPSADATASDVPELRPLHDRVLVKVCRPMRECRSGLEGMRTACVPRPPDPASPRSCCWSERPLRNQQPPASCCTRFPRTPTHPPDEHCCIRPQVQEHGDISTGGVLLPDSAKGKPLCGKVVAVGSGKRGADGKRAAPKLKPGDRVVYFK